WIQQRSRGVPRVVVGDFNAFPTTRPIAVMKKRFRSAYEVMHGQEPPNTVWTPLRTAEVGWRPSVGMVVDYIFVSDGLQVRDAWVAFDRTSPEDPTLCASDHYGLAATLEID
ncbi:MAG: endonuclease/exonuclease/phosphatase family protein, partial [Chloroflexota bacterium]|nr:endonuclease/exonuclease/phosphatase family protein [Chloroflexota bacterium]